MNKGKRNALEKRRILAYVKKETAVFHKRVSVKTAVFYQRTVGSRLLFFSCEGNKRFGKFVKLFYCSFNLSVGRSIKKKRHLDCAPQARARIVKVSSYARII